MDCFSQSWCTVMPYWYKFPGSHGRCCSNDSLLGYYIMKESLKLDATCSSKTLVQTYDPTWCNNPAEYHLPPPPPLFCMCFCLFLRALPAVSCSDHTLSPNDENFSRKETWSAFAWIGNFLVHARFVQTKLWLQSQLFTVPRWTTAHWCVSIVENQASLS